MRFSVSPVKMMNCIKRFEWRGNFSSLLLSSEGEELLFIAEHHRPPFFSPEDAAMSINGEVVPFGKQHEAP